MIFASFTLAVALLISAIAAYYSIVGLATIFAAATVPVIIMGTALEIGKIMAAVWLKLNWHRAQLTYKVYLVPAVAILMLLTSMGIFGFLSKAHLDQTAATGESSAQIQRLTTEIERRQTQVARAEERIKQLESTGSGQDAQTQNQIDREQARIDAALKRIEPAIQEQNAIIDSQLKIYNDQIKKIDLDLENLQNHLNKNEIARAQSLIGVQADGRLGPATTNAIRQYREKLSQEKQQINSQIEQSNRNPVIQAARVEITRIRRQVETQIQESNNLINRLRNQVGKTNTQNLDALIDEQQQRIKSANTELEQLIEQRYQLQSQFRKLEAEVGPVKYIAELIYGDDTNKDLLEKAVRLVIIIIVTVFDPLALVLILAAQQSFRWHKDNKLVSISDAVPESKIETVKEEEPIVKFFDINDHPYLNKKWVFSPSGDPVVVQTDLDQINYCLVCNSATINAGELGTICSNSSCSSYTQTPSDEFELRANSNLSIAESNSILVKENSVVEAKRSKKTPMITPPETLNIRKKILAVEDSNVNTNTSGFGLTFPLNPVTGDMFVRVDYNPNRLYKFNGFKWIEIDKTKSDTISFNDQYIDFLIQKIESGEYDLENLSESEQIQIEDKIRNQLNDSTKNINFTTNKKEN